MCVLTRKARDAARVPILGANRNVLLRDCE
jgi:hypothetical protein